MTGTPVQNHVNELWATFDFLLPNFLGSQSAFSKSFARPIASGQQPGASADAIGIGMEKLKILHQQVTADRIAQNHRPKEVVVKKPVFNVYECSVCKKSFTTAKYLYEHKTVKHGTAPFPCTYKGCKKGFISFNLFFILCAFLLPKGTSNRVSSQSCGGYFFV